ncbi:MULTISPECIES: DUF2721 domain-containing protein [Kaistia]|uniref:DUF2721 domain-containing protein n=1 Tax=Kaistia nematophila TaxID=2994654 RepID=A0A9X3E5X7_9HYPH|nr:DUF2721 domain-containing protein [Kaistia nematophila]MCX5571718.1 DUF2721 domain-containing protein [Kaistia nematophila]
MDSPTLSHLSQVMLHATAPAFLLGATASFVGLLVGRFNVLIDRSRSIHGISDDDELRKVLKSDIPRLRSRVRLLHRAISLAIASSLCTTLLIVWSFAAAFLDQDHQVGAALFFIVAMALFVGALLFLAREISIGLNDIDHLP